MTRQYPKSLKRFLDACIGETRGIIDGTDHSASRDLSLSFAETIYLENDALPRSRKLSQRQDFFKSLVFQFNELFTAYQTLIEFPVLARSCPPKNLKYSEARLVTFWREAYLNEYYIYLERLDVFIKKIGRWYRRDSRFPRLEKLAEGLRGIMRAEFEDLKTMRGSHVHEHRYYFSDPELRRVQLLELLAIEGKFTAMRPLYVQAIRNAKKQTIINFRRLNYRAKDSLKGVFDCFSPLFVDDNGRYIYPEHIKGA